MSRFIDAEELCRNNFMCDCKYGCCDYCYKTQQQKIDCEYYSTYSRMDFCQWIAETPTSNVCEVIPCGDCIYAKPYNKKWRLPINENLLWCEHHNEEKEPNWFCADAIERTVEDGEIH